AHFRGEHEPRPVLRPGTGGRAFRQPLDLSDGSAAWRRARCAHLPVRSRTPLLQQGGKGVVCMTAIVSSPRRILFVCVENSNRSRVAEAVARPHGGQGVEAYTAGSRPSGRVNPRAIEFMAERGYDLTQHRSKGLTQILEGEYDAAVTMGCGDECPLVRARRR